MHFTKAIVIMPFVAGTFAASIYPRQFGRNPIACNVARFQIVSALADTSDSVDKIKDQTVATAAKTGIDQATNGIGEIAKAILAGEAPPAASRNETATGITAATTALGGGDASDPAVVSAQSSIADAAKAGEDVVAQC
ncbi:hypothetical protein J3E72DRAFT_26430 [Bipolaris maydis]|uniref:uncharacterized protein n=1 Tax=Cochliobolus heterostrophus TaxID=5016 RepID=UPI000323631B|nr:hypothetical protein BM1_01438 [Bipolaris maydis]KAJ5031990.1 hypothetical protein J3E73DRAFT_4727 [Bipolaris maydis]KAJ5046931.1 hypothetical protein J3E74DRAFT_31619 [Bipolaris maydis]KAJ5059948.1 hypothetical protein J3E74DRAFT_44153 [Bipolaris maydis]KAJ6202252.1 hypothetical protein J3E72DRAFT_26430 [Bipolaris maydis]